MGRLLAMLSSTSCGACTAGVLAIEDEEAAGFIDEPVDDSEDDEEND